MEGELFDMIEIKDLFKQQSIQEYRTTAIDMLKYNFPQLSFSELGEAVDDAIKKGAIDHPSSIYNNYKNRTVQSTVYQMTQYILSRQPIMTSVGCLFVQHEVMVNPIKLLLDGYLSARKKLKKKMFEFPKGSEGYERYNLAQLLKKLAANGLYGLIGTNTSYFYNVHVASGITRQGRSSIANIILLFEGLLANNVQFCSLDDIIEFIHNVVNETPFRKYNDKDILDRNIGVEECWYKVMSNCGFSGYIPTEMDMDIVMTILKNVSQTDLNRIYYKNNLYAFCNNQSVQRAIRYILERLEVPFLDPNEVPESIEVEIKMFTDFIYEYVYYRHMYQDKIERVGIMYKSASVLTDTDSSMISLDAWYRYVLPMTYNLDMPIKRQFVDEKAFVLDGKTEVVDEESNHELDYNFFTDEFTEMYRATKVDRIVPQDSLRHSIINIMLNVVKTLSTDYLRFYSGSYNSYTDERCYLDVKNEMLMKRIMLTETARKHYAYYLEMQEGHPVDGKARLGITGLEMDKASIQTSVRERLKSILFNDILAPEEIDQKKVLVDMIKFEKEIYESLASGDTTYYKPVSSKSMNSYDDPMGQQGIKAALVYNATRDEGAPEIDMNERFNAYVVKVKITPLTVEKLETENPRIWNALQEFFKMKQFKNGINTYAVPHDTPTPKWVIEYIDYYQIINDNLKTFPIESIGLSGRAGNDSVTHSNVLKII